MKRKLSLAIFLLATLGVLATVISIGMENPDSPVKTALGAFKYFTIQSNVIVIIYFSMVYSMKFDSKPVFHTLLGGVTVYITITFIVFAALLQSVWNPQGLGLIGNILNHYAVPLMTIGFLIYFRKDYQFRYRDVRYWILYPIVYVIFLIIHGLVTQDYIYPFFEIDEIGFGNFILMFSIIMTLFLLLSYLCTRVTLIKSENKNSMKKS